MTPSYLLQSFDHNILIKAYITIILQYIAIQLVHDIFRGVTNCSTQFMTLSLLLLAAALSDCLSTKSLTVFLSCVSLLDLSVSILVWSGDL